MYILHNIALSYHAVCIIIIIKLYIYIIIIIVNSCYNDLHLFKPMIHFSGALPNRSDVLVDPEMDQELLKL